MNRGGIEIGGSHPRTRELITDETAGFLRDLELRFGPVRQDLLEARADRRNRLADGERLTFDAETEPIRRNRWTVTAPPKDLEDRRVEITGAPDASVMRSALASGARVFMADFEDACSPTWENVIDGHLAVRDFYRGDPTGERPADAGLAGAPYDRATLMVGVRGWHQDEPRVLVDGSPMSASLFDFGVCVFHNARESLDRGTGPYFSLPKMESHREARLWADVIGHAEERLDLDRGSIRVTILIETILAAFEMDEILHELRDHACGLNAGRSDYLFSMAKTFRDDPEFVLPDRSDIRMEVPFMRALGELLVSTCHRRGVHAIGGVTAAVPDQNDPEAAEIARTRISTDKRREAGDGFDGTLVAHPAGVPSAVAEFDRVLADRPNQIEVQRDDVYVTAGDLLAVRSTQGSITEPGVRANVRLGIRYLASWLEGTGVTEIDHLMVDMSTAELSRAQLWQWIHHRVELSNGLALTPQLVDSMIDDESRAVRSEIGEKRWHDGPHRQARDLFRRLALADEFAEFLPTAARDMLSRDMLSRDLLSRDLLTDQSSGDHR